jgi:hypothetical protein
MSVTREFRCTFHNHEFDSREEEPACPFGCAPEFVMQEFRTPFAIKHRETKFRDASTRDLAQAYGMSDIRSDKDGTSVMSNTPISSGGARTIGEQPRPYWGGDKVFPLKWGWRSAGAEEPKYVPPKEMTCAATPVEHLQKGAAHALARKTVIVNRRKP